MPPALNDTRAPKHVQVREHVRALLAGAEPGTATPSERDLVQRFGVARMTVRQALDALVAEGLLERIPGRGTYVAQPQRVATGIHGFSREMERRGVMAESQTLAIRREQAGPGVARALNITEGDAVIHWRRLRHGDGVPVCIEDAYLNEVLLPGFLHSAPPTSLYAALVARGLRPTWAEDSISADVATEEEASVLEVEQGAVVLRHSRRTLSDDRVVGVTRSVYRADRYTMWIQFKASD